MTHPAPKAIVYDARTIEPGMSGVGRYALNLLYGLARQPDAPPIRAWFQAGAVDFARRDPGLASVECLAAPYAHTSHPMGDLWLRWGLPSAMGPDECFFGPAFIVPGGRQPFRRVVMIHDLFVFTHPKVFGWKFRAWLRRSIRLACRHADAIVTPTAEVAAQIAAMGLAKADKIHPIPEAPDRTHPLWDAEAESRLQTEPIEEADEDAPLILTVGQMDPRKDPLTARRACIALGEWLNASAQEPLHWIWAGGSGTAPDPTPEAVRLQAEAHGFQAVGHASRGAIADWMNQAAVYVTCSRTEGFGIPLVEAMAAGCPVVATDIPVHREVAGDAALYFPEGDAQQLADLLAGLLADRFEAPERLSAMAQGGLARAEQFSWDTTAEKTLGVCTRREYG